MRLWLPVITATLLSGCTIFSADEPPQTVEAALARWQRAGIVDYSFQLATTCFCVGPQGSTRVVVRDGAVTAVTLANGKASNPAGWPSMQALLHRLRDAAQTGTRIDASFDSRGAVVEATVGQLANDSGVRYQVRSFAVE